jgi:MFS transporter, DHA1 family, multidrug resistance protein
LEQWQKNLWILWFGALVTSISFSMVIPFLPLFLPQIGVTHHQEMWSGMLYSVTFLMGALVSPYWGSLADKYGRKPMIVRAGFSLCFIYFLTAFVQSPWELLALRGLQGLLAGYIPGAIALVGTNTPENRVGWALSLMSTATAAGNILGPLFGGLVSRVLNYRISFASAGVLVFLSSLLVVFWVKEYKFVPAKTRTGIVQTMKDASANPTLRLALLLTTLTSFSIMTIEPVLPLYISHMTSSSKNTSLIAGLVFSLAGIASVMFAPRWGRMADKQGFRRVLLIGLIGGGIGNLLQIPFENVWAFSTVRFLYGVFFCAVFPALNGFVVQSTDSTFRGRAFGLSQTANQVGNMLGPLVGGVVGGLYGTHSVFSLTGILLLLTLSVGWRGFRARPLKSNPPSAPA